MKWGRQEKERPHLPSRPKRRAMVLISQKKKENTEKKRDRIFLLALEVETYGVDFQL